jgi:hypothetical protein
MSKRVTLSYTIDLEDLNTEVCRLYMDAARHLCETAENAQRDPMTDLLTPATVESIHETRLQLVKINELLADISAIIVPYLEYACAPQTPTDDGPALTDIERMRALQEKVTNALAASSPESSDSE